MGNENKECKCQGIETNSDILIAIGAATAVNCIPCFEHLYEKAITSGISSSDIKRASEIAGQVKNGAHIALRNVVDELIGPEKAETKSASADPCCQ